MLGYLPFTHGFANLARSGGVKVEKVNSCSSNRGNEHECLSLSPGKSFSSRDLQTCTFMRSWNGKGEFFEQQS